MTKLTEETAQQLIRSIDDLQASMKQLTKMKHPIVAEEIVRATILQLTKAPELSKEDNFSVWFRAKEEKKKLKRIIKKL
jgi:hypothetical protein